MTKYAAELFGTFVLVFAGLGTAVLAGSQVGNVGVALAFGLALLAMAFSVGPISGCHINPAVTLGFLLSKRMKASDAAGYWIAQLIGGAIASGFVLFIANGAPGGSIASLAGAKWIRGALARPLQPGGLLCRRSPSDHAACLHRAQCYR